jgi:hypothetical protein
MASNRVESAVIERENLKDSTESNFIRQPHRTTISRRAKGQIQPREQYVKYSSLLSKPQEEMLLSYISKLTKKGLPPNHYNLRVFTSNICGQLPSKSWATKFIRQHKEKITSHYLVGFDLTRKKADNYYLINKYFEIIREKISQYQFAPQNVYNMDEKGFLIGLIQKTRRIFTKA